MGQMKWIYQMVQDGTIVVFKQLYNNAVKYKLNSFIFESRSVDVMLAQAIIKVAAKAEKEYEDHIDEEAARQADAYYEWTQTIYE
tara:strand:+ start:1968 stop:2222 length:255 start_codon:yes stop_codon:yes gene_type:complete